MHPMVPQPDKFDVNVTAGLAIFMMGVGSIGMLIFADLRHLPGGPGCYNQPGRLQARGALGRITTSVGRCARTIF